MTGWKPVFRYPRAQDCRDAIQVLSMKSPRGFVPVSHQNKLASDTDSPAITSIAKCELCGNDYDKTFETTVDGKKSMSSIASKAQSRWSLTAATYPAPSRGRK